jgi:FkbM family methyltransferase
MILHYPDRKIAIADSLREAHAVALGDNRLLCRVLGKFKMVLDSRDVSQGPYLAMDGIYDLNITELLCDTVKQGMVCCDVGASAGYHTLIMTACAGPTGFTHAFEPNPRQFTLLKANIEMADFATRVALSQEAIGDSAGLGVLLMHRKRFGGATLSPAMQSSYGLNGDKTNVAITTLDDRLLSRGVEPDFYLISCCAYEAQVLRGMKGLLRNKRKVQVLIEAFPKFQADTRAFATELLDQGFSVRRVDGDHLTPIDDPDQLGRAFKTWLLLSR